MSYKMKPGSKEKDTPTSFNEKDSKVIKGTTTGRMSEAEAKAFESKTPDLEVTITASKQKVPRGGSAPTPGSANVDKVIEMKKKRTFKKDEALTKKEKEEGSRAASKTYSKQKVSFKTKK